MDDPQTNRSTQDVRSSRTLLHNNYTAPAALQANIRPVSQLSLSNKSTAIETNLREEKFSRAPDKAIDLTLQDVHICANNHSLTNQERSMLVANSLRGGALEFNLNRIDPKLPYTDIVDKLRSRYALPHRKLSLKSESVYNVR